MAALATIIAAEAMSAGAGFSILGAELVPLGANYVLNADVSYDFSPSAIAALENSVPLTLILKCRIARDRPYWWDETIIDYRQRIEIRYHPLGKLFQMELKEHEALQSFTSLYALLESLGAIRGLPVVPSSRIERGRTYRASLSVTLDIEALPLPLRPSAYLSPEWYLSSPWYRWSFQKSG